MQCRTPLLGAQQGTSSDPRAAGGAQGSQPAPQSRGPATQRPRGDGQPARTAAGRLERGRASRAARVKALAGAGQGQAYKSLGQTPPPPGRPRRRASPPSAPRQRLRAVPAHTAHTGDTIQIQGLTLLSDHTMGPVNFTPLQKHVLAKRLTRPAHHLFPTDPSQTLGVDTMAHIYGHSPI